MPQVCLYLQLHQPYRLDDVEVFDIGQPDFDYFSTKSQKNAEIFHKVSQKSYLPMLRLLRDLLQREIRFVFSLSASGLFLEQALEHEPEIIALIKAMVKTGRVELLAETYHHSLASLYSPTEFERQVFEHSRLIQKLFGVTPRVFRNTELIYSNDIAWQVAGLGFSGMLTEAVDRYLHGRPRTQIYYSHTAQPLPLLLKHAQLSDDVAFRFSDKSWTWHPLTVDRYLDWVEMYPEHDLVNLFMDFETFGEHQWQDTGIFEFFAEFVHRFIGREWNQFVTPSQAFALHSKSTNLERLSPSEIYSVPQPISWADVDRDLTAWTENALQQDTLRSIYALEATVLQPGNEQLVKPWRRLQTSDHFYYMCTKWAADGDVHAYFSPFSSPLEAYRQYSIALADLQERVFSLQGDLV